MPRSRNIKHGFFTNDDLAQNDPLGRLLFIGLWTLADYKGDLKWKTRRIKAQLLPYDDCDVESLAINLDKSGFIRFYSDGNEIYARVLNFDRHQNPHKNERAKGSDVPEYSDQMRQVIDLKGLTINHDKSGLIPEGSASDPADSCSLIPDPGNLIPEKKELSHSDKPNTDDVEQAFEAFWSAGMRKVGSKKDTFNKFKRLAGKDPHGFAQMLITDVKRRLASGQMGFDQLHPKTYLNGERWNDEYVSNLPATAVSQDNTDYYRDKAKQDPFL